MRRVGRLWDELVSGSYRPGAYRDFTIFEPKRRIISAAPYRDRVVHHAVCQVVAPVLERSFISDSYAHRVGFGTHRALRRFTRLLRGHRYVLQCDVVGFYPNLVHDVLKRQLRRRLKCRDTLQLLDTIIDGPGESTGRGLPIGNLTSQLFGNVYLDPLDHFVRETLGWKGYLRFVDDFALFGDSAVALGEARTGMADFVGGLGLELHPVKTQLVDTRRGACFLGFRVLRDRTRVRRESLKRGRRRLRELAADFAAGSVSVEDVGRSVTSWVAHLAHGNTWRLREKIFEALVLTRSKDGADTRAAGRFLEQQ